MSPGPLRKAPMKLQPNPPAWCSRYVGLPFLDRGRTTDGLDCWGLVCLVYANRFGIALPSLSHVPSGDAAAQQVELEQQLRGSWTDTTFRSDHQPSIGDVLLMHLGRRLHVGLRVSKGHFLHVLENTGSTIERLDSPLFAKRITRHFKYTAPVLVRHSLTPLHDTKVDMGVVEGKTIEEIRVLAGVDALPGLRAFLGAREVPAVAWTRVRPKAGRILRFTCVPAGGDSGGGKSPLRTVMSIALLAATIAAPFALVGVGANAATWGAGTLGGSLFAAGVGIVGSLALNALIPPPSPAISDGAGQQVSPSITGARNELRKFVAVPRLLGTHRLVPVYAAVPVTENVDGDTYLRLLFLLGYGPLDISDLRIGETPLSEFDGVEVQIRSGGDDDGPLSLYPSTIIEDAMSVLLKQAEGWQVRTSAIDADEIAVDVTWPQGIAEIARDGSRIERAVAVRVQFAPTGTNAWRDVNGTSPDNERALDVLFRTPDVRLGGQGVVQGPVLWGGGFAGTKPSFLPASNFAYELTGYVRFPYTSQFTTLNRVEFAIDGSDACDLQVLDRTLITFYGQHATEGGATPGTSNRSQPTLYRMGFAKIRIRVEARQGNPGALALLWRVNDPGGGQFVPIPAENLCIAPREGATGLNYRWFDTTAYAGAVVVSSSSTDSIRRTISFAVPRGQYDIRVQRETPDTDSESIVDRCFLTAVKTIRNVDPVRMRGVAKVALRIKASNQLNGVIDNFNCLATSILPDWDAAAQVWVERATNNPASCMRALVQSRGAFRPLADDKLNLAELQQFHDECRVLGFACNYVVDTKGTAWERLRDVAATGRARVARPGGKVTPIREKLHTTPVQHFSARTMQNFVSRKAFGDVPHALRITFMNEARGYERDERVVYADGFDITNATRFDTLELPGVTNPDQVYRLGRYYLAAMILRPEVFSARCSLDHLACGVGDMVYVSHDVPLFGLSSARITALVTDAAGNIAGLQLDEEIVMDAGDTYGIFVRLASNDSWSRELVTREGVSTQVKFVSAVAPGAASPQVGDLVLFGRAGQEVRRLIVKSIEVDARLQATLTFVDDAPAVLTADSEPIPPYDPGISTPPTFENRPATPVIENIRSDDYVLVRAADGSLQPRMVISYRIPASNRPLATHVQVRVRQIPGLGQTGDAPWRVLPQLAIDGNEVSVGDVIEGSAYQIRLRAVSAIGQTSDWAEAEHVVIGKSLPPPDVLAFDVERLSDGIRRYSFDLGDIPPDVVGVQIRFARSPGPELWNELTPLHEGTLEGVSPTDLPDPPASGRYLFAIRMVDSVGNLSRNARTVIRDLGTGSRPDVAVSVDAAALRFPGTKTGCFVTRRGVLEAVGEETWDTLASFGVTSWDTWPLWTLRPANPIRYEHPTIDAGFVFDFQPDVHMTFKGSRVVELQHSIDDVTYSDWERIEAFTARTVRARYIRFRVTVFITDGFPVPSIEELVFMLRAEMITQVVNDLDTATLTGDRRLGVGDVRVPIGSSQLGAITSVQVSFNGLGAGFSYVVVDKATLPGPRIRIFNDLDLPADAVIDVRVTGPRGLE